MFYTSLLVSLIDIVDVAFTTHAGKWCNYQAGSSGDTDNCKELCVGRSDCGGIVISGGTCIFLRESCKDHLLNVFLTTVYLKTVN